jgi:tetratricopeptide (TPR) repeat protein
MAEIARRNRDFEQAEDCLARCIQAAPDHEAYRFNYACVLSDLGKFLPALDQADMLLAKDPENILYLGTKGALLSRVRKFAESADCYRKLTAMCPNSAEAWYGLASALRSIGGNTEESLSALRKVTELDPSYGHAWWALASAKTFRFTDADVRLMEAQVSKPAVGAAERTDLYYALGKAYDDVKQYDKSFQCSSKGNAIKRIGLDYDPDATTAMVDRARAVFTPEFFAQRAGLGCPSTEPIFVVGLQRSGSTLTEQILGAHTQIEPAGELQTLLRVVVENVMPKTGANYPYGMDKLTPDDLRSFAEQYLEFSRAIRTSDEPYYVDKNCYNIWQIGLIHLILPNARIIDIRRHPISCCWANFTISFAHAPPLSYKLTDVGRFYYDYVRLMAHFDRVLPGKIHRVIYENLVSDLEGEVRRMLDFLDLPFEQSCLEYYKYDRAFSSFSNEQVRRPIFTEGVERWRSYDPWLGPLKKVLGPVLEAYPDVPEFKD